jgi:hypothetical protein
VFVLVLVFFFFALPHPHNAVRRGVCLHHCETTSHTSVLRIVAHALYERPHTKKRVSYIHPLRNTRCCWCFVLLPRLSQRAAAPPFVYASLLPRLPTVLLPHPLSLRG